MANATFIRRREMIGLTNFATKVNSRKSVAYVMRSAFTDEIFVIRKRTKAHCHFYRLKKDFGITSTNFVLIICGYTFRTNFVRYDRLHAY